MRAIAGSNHALRPGSEAPDRTGQRREKLARTVLQSGYESFGELRHHPVFSNSRLIAASRLVCISGL